MPLPESSLSIVCNSIAEFVRLGVGAVANNITVSLGSPAEMEDVADQHRINLFFYRFEPSGFDSSSLPNEPWNIRLFCLVTAFGADEDGITSGENDLRMLGELIRIFREMPISAAIDVAGQQVRLQTIFSPVTDEQINQIWSTQGDTTYRASLIYEMALAPIMPSVLRTKPPLVGAFGREAFASHSQQFAGFSGEAEGPLVGLSVININDPMWQPHLCWVYQNTCSHTLNFDIDGPEFAAFSAQLWIAGDSSVDVSLTWDVWDPVGGWRSVGVPVIRSPFNQTIDPDNIPAAIPGIFPSALPMPLPVTIPVGQNAAQGLLYASRDVVLIAGQPAVQVRSNPLLISLYRTV
jgi:hypothetical protein